MRLSGKRETAYGKEETKEKKGACRGHHRGHVVQRAPLTWLMILSTIRTMDIPLFELIRQSLMCRLKSTVVGWFISNVVLGGYTIELGC